MMFNNLQILINEYIIYIYNKKWKIKMRIEKFISIEEIWIYIMHQIV